MFYFGTVETTTPADIAASQDAAEATTPNIDAIHRFRTGSAIAPIALLAACGGATGGGTTGSSAGTTVTPSGGVVVVSAPPTDTEASRFLAQATMGANRAGIADVVAKGYEPWIDAQFKLPRATTLWDAMIARGESAFVNVNSIDGYDASVWRSLIAEPDQLRQRIATALLDFIVVGANIQTVWPQMHMAAFFDVLADNAFGNYRTLLGQITLNPAMAIWLSLMSNKKADPATGSQPDENYAREIMQLFSIGLYQLNMDGSLKTANGVPIDTYAQRDVSQLARIFTGLTQPDWDWKKYTIARNPLIMEPTLNETGASTFLGRTITGGGMAAVNAALDTIFAHPNVPPFISHQLIQRLVTSNPSPAYIQRVATVFADNGKGVRGDLQAVVKAILLDTEARSSDNVTSTTFGRLRSPVQRLTAWARAFNATSPGNAWAIGNTASAATGIGQSTGQAPSVFNFFRPGYTPPGSDVQTRGLVAPEFQIANEQSVISYVNFMYKLVGDGIGDLKADYSALTPLANDSGALVNEVNVLLAAGQLSGTTIATIKGAVDGAGSATAKINIAVLLTLAAPEFLVTR